MKSFSHCLREKEIRGKTVWFPVMILLTLLTLSTQAPPPLWTKEVEEKIQECVASGSSSVLLLRETTRVEVLDSQGSPVNQILPALEGIFGWAVSPATPYFVVYGFTEESSRAILFDFAGKTIKVWEEKQGDYFWNAQWSPEGKRVGLLVAKPPPEPKEKTFTGEASSDSEYAWVLRIYDEKGNLLLESSPVSTHPDPLWAIASDSFFLFRSAFDLHTGALRYALPDELLQDVRQFQFNGRYLAMAYKTPVGRQELFSLMDETGEVLWTKKMQVHALKLLENGDTALLGRDGFFYFNPQGVPVLHRAFPHPMAALDVEVNFQKSIVGFSYRIPKHYVPQSPEVIPGENPYLPRLFIYRLSSSDAPILQFREPAVARQQMALSRDGKILYTCGDDTVAAYSVPTPGIWQSLSRLWKRFLSIFSAR